MVIAAIETSSITGGASRCGDGAGLENRASTCGCLGGSTPSPSANTCPAPDHAGRARLVRATVRAGRGPGEGPVGSRSATATRVHTNVCRGFDSLPLRSLLHPQWSTRQKESCMERKLVSIQRIDGIEPIDGADRIVKARVMGWDVVVKKGELGPGDPCVFFEIDSVLPAGQPWAEFM